MGRDINPIVTTVAPTIPVLAASKAPTTIIEIDKPPLTLLKANAIFFNILAAMPDFSRIVPIKINNGTASKVTLFIIPKILIGMLLKMVGSNIPKGMQINANKIDIPPKVKATGYPAKRATHIMIRSSRGISSIFCSRIDIKR